MQLRTPTDGLIKNGELYGIRNAYSAMVNESVEAAQKEKLFKSIYEAVKNADYDKLTRFAKKNTKLAMSATKQSIKKACTGLKCDEAMLTEVCKRVATVIANELPKPKKLSGKQTAKSVGKMKPGKMIDINEDQDDDDNGDDADYSDADMQNFRGDISGIDTSNELTPEHLKMIDDLTKDVAYDREMSPEMKKDLIKSGVSSDDIDGDDGKRMSVGRDDALSRVNAKRSSSDRLTSLDNRPGLPRMSDEFDKEGGFSGASDAEPRKYFEYCVQSIRMCITVNGKVLGEPTSLWFTTPSNMQYKIQSLTDMEQVIDWINSTTGFYFEIDDYSYNFAKEAQTGKPSLLMAKKVLNSDVVQGSKAFNKYFGPNGKYADYLYKADGTAKFAPDSKGAEDADGAAKDTDVVSSYPVVWVGANVKSRNRKTKAERPIKPIDFRNTAVVVKECTTNEGTIGSGIGGAVGNIAGKAIGGALGSVAGPIGTAIGSTLGGLAGSAAGAALGADKGNGAAAATGAAAGSALGGTLGAGAGGAIGNAVSGGSSDESVNEETNSEREALANGVNQFGSVISGIEAQSAQTVEAAKQLVSLCKDNASIGFIKNMVAQAQNVLNAVTKLKTTYQNDVYANIMK